MGYATTTVSTEEMQFQGISGPSAASRTWGLYAEERQPSVLYCVVDGRIVIPLSFSLSCADGVVMAIIRAIMNDAEHDSLDEIKLQEVHAKCRGDGQRFIISLQPAR